MFIGKLLDNKATKYMERVHCGIITRSEERRVYSGL